MKARFKITIAGEYDVPDSMYPDGSTIEEMIALDKNSMETEPESFLDMGEVSVEIEQVKET